MAFFVVALTVQTLQTNHLKEAEVHANAAAEDDYDDDDGDNVNMLAYNERKRIEFSR